MERKSECFITISITFISGLQHLLNLAICKKKKKKKKKKKRKKVAVFIFIFQITNKAYFFFELSNN